MNYGICDSCGKPLRSKYGMDLSGRLYCKRILCKLAIKINKITISNETKQLIIFVLGMLAGITLMVV